VVIPSSRHSLYENIYSPNGDYYFVSGNADLTIYDTPTREKLVEFELEPPEKSSSMFGREGGWASDSSGVYFQVGYGGGFSPITNGAIRKLNVQE